MSQPGHAPGFLFLCDRGRYSRRQTAQDDAALSHGQATVQKKVGYPRLRESGIVLVEVWEEPQQITLGAYFLDEPDAWNAAGCRA